MRPRKKAKPQFNPYEMKQVDLERLVHEEIKRMWREQKREWRKKHPYS